VISQSLDTLRQQQATSGLNLREDISASQDRMHRYISRANSAIEQHDIGAARKYLNLADAEISRLEKFFGK
jgi:hypothetical protein